MKLPFPTHAPSIAAALAACCALFPLTAATQQPVLLDQGADWTASTRSDYYSRSQGSRVIPLRWMSALKQSDGQPFMAESLSRYGYLPNSDSDPPGLPVGFTVSNTGTHGEIMGMTCSACHTRQIEVAGTPYRADGGPAIVDFQSFLQDLDSSVQTILKDPQAFKAFADEVLGPGAPPDKVRALHLAVADWALPYHTLMHGALPTPAWGPSRLDAVAMIFNRLVGLDIGAPPTYLIPENIQPADAPVRYPFLWNAPKQDFTQWPSFAANGTPLLGLTRNLGEVYGVFADFKPSKDGSPLGIDYTGVNSADFSGLSALEDLIGKIGPPKWPWPVDQAMAKQGQTLYEKPGSCADCHGVKTSWKRFPHETWATPVCDVGTDRREYAVLHRQAKTGVLKGALVPGWPPSRIAANDAASSVLGVSVIGAILQHYAPLSKNALSAPSTGAAGLLSSSLNRADFDQLLATYDPLKQPLLKGLPPSLLQATPSPCAPASASAYSYESRVLQGIWAAAPYLHNGSVRSLAELLKPSSERASEFKIGPNYDTKDIGLAVDQTKFNYVLKTTDCSAINSGSSRCGHEGPSYGTTLSPEEKTALLEYLKTL